MWITVSLCYDGYTAIRIVFLNNIKDCLDYNIKLKNQYLSSVSTQGMYRKRPGKTRYNYDKNVISGWKKLWTIFLLYTFLCNFSSMNMDYFSNRKSKKWSYYIYQIC